jgi:hypothetical protein
VLAALLAIFALVLLAGCSEPPVRRVTATFVPGTGDARATSAAVPAGRAPAVREAQCDVQNSVLQDSGLPLLQVSPVAPRSGEPLRVTAGGLVPGARTLTLVAPFEPERRVNVTVTPDGRLDATFAMPPVTPGLCAMLWLDGTGVQSLGFLVME